jgi:predicted signal transduction protein with EAL and GGDEF domain
MHTTLLDDADKALYHAKETGRNKIVIYEDIMKPISESDGSDIEFFKG